MEYREKLYTESEEQFNLPVDVVYYIESEWDYKTNAYIRKHRQELEQILNEAPERLLTYKFCYIPRDANSQEVQALFPMAKIHTAKKLFRLIPSFARKRDGENPRLLTHLLPNQYGDEEHLGFFAFDIEDIDSKDIPDLVRKYIHKVEDYNHEALKTSIDYRPRPKIQFDIETILKKGYCSKSYKKTKVDDDIQLSVIGRKDIRPQGDIRYSLSMEEPNPEVEKLRAERKRKEQERLRALAERIKAEIDELQRQNGINILTEILSEEHKALIKQPVPVSRMSIDSKFRIWLDDYDHLEIKMPTLCKAVYFLFLKHPEGIFLKDIWDYHDELREIYMTISLRTNMDQMEQSIDDLVDITSDSLQQKLSKISAAFRANLAADYAKLYTINGKRGEAYSVSIDRSKLDITQELRNLL